MATCQHGNIIKCTRCGSEFTIAQANLQNIFQSHIHCPVCSQPLYRIGAVPILGKNHIKPKARIDR